MLQSSAGKGYGLVAAHDIPKGTLLAICQPLTWISGLPGSPPKLDALVQHMKQSNFTEAQMDVLLSLCSLPNLDDAHGRQQQRQHQQQRQDRLLRAGQQLESQGVPGRGQAVSSYSLSKSRQLKQMQKKIMQDQGHDWNDEGSEDEMEPQAASHRGPNDPWRDGGSSKALQQRAAAGPRRRTPDLLELLECTKEGSDAGSTAATGSSAGSSSWPGRGARSDRWDDNGSSSRALQQNSQLRMSLER